MAGLRIVARTAETAACENAVTVVIVGFVRELVEIAVRTLPHSGERHAGERSR
jgi:hypothetical protein